MTILAMPELHSINLEMIILKIVLELDRPNIYESLTYPEPRIKLPIKTKSWIMLFKLYHNIYIFNLRN